MRRLWTIGCFFAVALSAGCVANSSSSGSSSNPPPTNGIAVTPTDARIAAGQTQQFKVTVSGNPNADVIWQVNGVTGGKAGIGTISTDGVYTAPTLPPTGGNVTITAVATSSSSLKGTASATIQYSNASLKGTWVFTYRAANLGVIGRFEADGAGNINAGNEDVNASDGVFLNLPFNGSYTVAADGTGEAVFVSTRGQADFQFVIGARGRVRFIRADSGIAGAGDMLAQSADVGGDASLSGDYIFKLTDTRTAIVGRFSADGTGGVANAVEDRNTAGAVTTDVPFDAAYAVDDNGRGTMTLTNVFGTMHYVFYVVAPDTIRLLSVDPAQIRTGRALAQTATTFDDSDLSGNYAFYLTGGTDAPTTAGLLHADGAGNIDSGEFDSSGTGTVQQRALSGGYAIDDTGRGTARLFTPAGQTDLIFYLQSAGHALAIEADSTAMRDGQFLVQSDDKFAESSLDGSFALSTGANASAQQTAVGRISLDGNGNIDGVETTAAGGSGSATALGGSYTLDQDGRGTLTLLTEGGGQQDFVFYAISPQNLLLVGFNPVAAAFTRLRQRW
ncbi:MAG TPA: hypothetical protein VFK24_04285 [Gammaproteobacteria bacterium]|nr:hypothetical protein [Gammaproteobacteria bacterium]